MKILIRALLLVLICVGDGHEAFGAEGSAFMNRPARVSVSVSHHDQSLMNTISSYLKRELRELSDVEVVSTDEDFRIEVVALSDRTVSGKSLGYTMSIVVEVRQESTEIVVREMRKHIETCSSAESLRWVLKADPTVGMVLVKHVLYSVSPDNLKETSERFIAEFDGDVLEGSREAAQLVKDYLKTTDSP